MNDIVNKQLQLYYSGINNTKVCCRYKDKIKNDNLTYIDFTLAKYLIENFDYKLFDKLIGLSIDNNTKYDILKLIQNELDTTYFLSDDQLNSKKMLSSCNKMSMGSVISVASWYGQHHWFLNNYDYFTFNEIDNTCVDILKMYNKPVIYGDMIDIEYEPYDTIVNTSCEHIDFDRWLSLIPSGKRLILQSTNMPDEVHINIFRSIGEFLKSINPHKIIKKEELFMKNDYTRFFVDCIK